MFIVTIVNFLLFSVNTGNQIAGFTFLVRKALVLDIDYPLSEKRVLVNNVLHNLDIIYFWTGYLPVSISSCRCHIPYLLLMLCGDVTR